jgi:hypothetical protein
MAARETVTFYTKLITSEYRIRSPKFMEWISFMAGIFVDTMTFSKNLYANYLIDSAVGVQLDVLGTIIGLDRTIKVPLDGLFFTWDSDDSALGWDEGSWASQSDINGSMTELADDAYRQMLKFKIIQNSWDGTVNSLYSAWNTVFSVDGLTLQVVDNQDMTMELIVTGKAVPAVVKYILQDNYLPLKPSGVSITYSFVTT